MTSSGSNADERREDFQKTLEANDGTLQRTFRDYVLVLRERLWYVVIVFLVVVLASVAYVLSATKLYTAVASIEILPRDAVVMKVQEVRDGDLRGPEDLNTQVKILESSAIVAKVAARLSADEAKALIAPYEKGSGGDPIAPEDLLGPNRKVLPVRQTRVLQITYTHPDPDVAAKIANLFVEEYMNYNVRWRVDESIRAVEELKVRADEQSKKVEELGNALQEYKENHNMVSLDQRKDIVTQKLTALSTFLTEANARVTEASVHWNQVLECRASGKNLADLAFISPLPQISQLQAQIDSQNVAIADLRQRYRSEHPKMLAAMQSLSQAQAELKQALENAASTVHNALETAQRDAAQAKADLAAQEAEELKLDRLSVEYSTRQNELNVNQELLSSIVSRMRETSMNATIEEHNARVVDAAARPRRFSSPNIALDLAGGALGGLALGLSLAFLVAFIDDRVKSAYQIESVVGIPLIGIVPRTKKMENSRRAQIVRNGADPLAGEAFLTIHSNLRLKNESKNAKVFLVTSTRPGEGKSFVTSNLALTFAEHGERTILVDCDLRKPNVHKLFGIANTKGVIDYCTSDTSLDKLVIKNQAPNFDLLLAGGRAVNPTHVLNYTSFPRMIEELRKNYDRVFIDTPPLAPVSDAMIVLPFVDGVLFTIRFNHVRTRGVKFCVRRILESKVPCYGAVLNGLDLSLSEYYYAEYYDKSYRSYIRDSSAATSSKS
jgi:capsular exopolysaccharide synthesis family protein